MRILFGIPFVLALAACGGPSAQEQASDPEAMPFTPEEHSGTIMYCNDGDTCAAKLDSDTTVTKIRLAGIDAPETHGGPTGRGQPLGKEAKDFLNQRLRGKKVKVYKTDGDMYGRMVAEIRVNGKLVNLEMVKAGHVEAYKYARHVDKKVYREAEATAKAARKGIWSLDDYQSPSDFRREERERLGLQ